MASMEIEESMMDTTRISDHCIENDPANTSSELTMESTLADLSVITLAGNRENSTAAVPVNLASYFSSFSDDIRQIFNNQLDFTCHPKRFNAIIACNKDVEVPIEIPMKCSIHHLRVNEECPGFIAGERGMDLNLARKIPLAGVHNLDSLQLLKRSGQMRTSHYRDKSWTMAAVKGSEADLVPLEELVITIRVHQPYCAVDDEEKMNLYRPKPQQEFKVLGSNYLTQLRDIITCPNHFIKAGEFSENPKRHVNVPYAKDIYKSGFFFFENIFYNDMRDPTNLDYSEPIRKWMGTNTKVTPNKFETALMEETRFQDLTIRMGYPYVYQHVGDCEHLVIFLNARLINRPDELCSKLYPMQRCPFRQSPRLCSLCGFYAARWVTFKNKRMPHDPSYFCNSCMMSFNYVDGKKVGDFLAYFYLEREPTEKDMKYTVEIEMKEQDQFENSKHSSKLKKDVKECHLFEEKKPHHKTLLHISRNPKAKEALGIDYNLSNASSVSINMSTDKTSYDTLKMEVNASVIEHKKKHPASTLSRCNSVKFPIRYNNEESESSSEKEVEDISHEYEKSSLVSYTKGLPKNPDEDFYIDKYTRISDADSDVEELCDDAEVEESCDDSESSTETEQFYSESDESEEEEENESENSSTWSDQ